MTAPGAMSFATSKTPGIDNPFSTLSYANSVIVLTSCVSNTRPCLRRFCNKDLVIDAGQTDVLHPHNIHLRISAKNSAQNVFVKIFVGQKTAFTLVVLKADFVCLQARIGIRSAF